MIQGIFAIMCNLGGLYKVQDNILELSIDNHLTQTIAPNMRMQMCYFDM